MKKIMLLILLGILNTLDNARVKSENIWFFDLITPTHLIMQFSLYKK
jgi:hypothetical protein